MKVNSFGFASGVTDGGWRGAPAATATLGATATFAPSACAGRDAALSRRMSSDLVPLTLSPSLLHRSLRSFTVYCSSAAWLAPLAASAAVHASGGPIEGTRAFAGLEAPSGGIACGCLDGAAAGTMAEGAGVDGAE